MILGMDPATAVVVGCVVAALWLFALLVLVEG